MHCYILRVIIIVCQGRDFIQWKNGKLISYDNGYEMEALTWLTKFYIAFWVSTMTASI